MKDGKQQEEDYAERVPVLNKILENLVSDASDLIRDLYWGVKTYLFFGLVTLFFGIQEIISYVSVPQERFSIPVFIGAALIFCGFVQIFNYFRLGKKYAKLFNIQKELKGS